MSQFVFVQELQCLYATQQLDAVCQSSHMEQNGSPNIGLGLRARKPPATKSERID